MSGLSRHAVSLLWHDKVRSFVGRARYVYFAWVMKRLRTLESSSAIDHTIEHNLRSLGDQRGARMKRLLAPLLAIETLGPESRFLVVGPRTESDLLLLASLGFSLSRIRGLDLISYSPLIDLGDMHAMPYADNSFDVVICGWTLSYSNEPERAAQEMVRVCRPNGLIAVAVEYFDTPGELIPGSASYVLEVKDRPRINSVNQLRELFSPAVQTVYLEHDAPARRSHGPEGLVANPSSVLLAFSVAKAAQASALTGSKMR